MRLFWHEMRKIWRPGILAALVVLGGLYYSLRLSFFVEQYDGGRWAWSEQAAEYQLRVELIRRYGPRLALEELPALERELAGEKERFAQLVRDVPEAAEAGLTSYDAVYAVWNNPSEGGFEILNAVRPATNYGRVYALDNLLQRSAICTDSAFDLTESPVFKDSTPQVRTRLAELEGQRGAGVNLMGRFSLHNTFEYIKFTAVWVVLSVILLLSPTLVRDRLRGTRAMQWTSRRGRRVLGVQMAAGLVSAGLLTAADLAALAVPLAVKGAGTFWDCELFTREGSPFPWFDWTYGQYVLAAAGMLLVLGVIAGALTLFLSQYSASYVPMLLKAVPLFIAVGVLFAYTLTEDMFCFYRTNGLFYRAPPAFEAPVFAAALALGLGLCAWSCARQGKREAGDHK